MRIIFMGTPDFSVSALEALIQAGHEIICCYSQPPRRAGRGKKETPTAVHQCALKHNIEVRTPVSLKSKDEQVKFQQLEADIAVIVAYGLLLPKAILEAPTHGCLNIHASLLPRWRGAAPIQRAIEAGDEQTGVCIMQMDEGLDTGDVLSSHTLAITPNMNAGQLHDQLAEIGAELIVKTLSKYSVLTATAQPDNGVTYARKITKAETNIDWQQAATSLLLKIRAFAPYPAMYFTYKNERFRVLEAVMVEHIRHSEKAGVVLDDKLTIACGEGAIQLLTIQRQGKQAMSASDLLRGYPIPEGEILSC